LEVDKRYLRLGNIREQHPINSWGVCTAKNVNRRMGKEASTPRGMDSIDNIEWHHNVPNIFNNPCVWRNAIQIIRENAGEFRS
jgi:hypothetical protein